MDDRTAAGGALDLDACLTLLADRRRRALLRYFVDSDAEHAEIEEITAAIVADEADAWEERPGPDMVASALVHVHLPKLTEAGVLDYDTRHHEVRYRGDPLIEELYDAVRAFE